MPRHDASRTRANMKFNAHNTNDKSIVSRRAKLQTKCRGRGNDETMHVMLRTSKSVCLLPACLTCAECCARLNRTTMAAKTWNAHPREGRKGQEQKHEHARDPTTRNKADEKRTEQKSNKTNASVRESFEFCSTKETKQTNMS